MLHLTVFTLIVAAVIAQQSGPLGPCGKAAKSMTDIYTPGARIVNGKFIQPGSWPWLAALVKYKPSMYPGENPELYHFCGSALVHPQWIVTASHCVDSATQEEMKRTIKVVLGDRNLMERLTRTNLRAMLPIAKVILHEQYDQPAQSTNYDIALIKLAAPIPRRKLNPASIYPVCLPENQINQTDIHPSLRNAKNGRPTLFVAGWGYQREGGDAAPGEAAPKIGAGSDIAKQVDVEMYPHADCVNRLTGYYFSEQMICGGFDEGGKDSCQGDSGGPLIQFNQKSKAHELAGVVSWGAGCAQAGKPGIYTNVRNMRDWIVDTIKKN